MSIFDQEAPLTQRNFFKGNSLDTYYLRNRERWQKRAASIKRAFTLYSLLGILSLASITLQTHFA